MLLRLTGFCLLSWMIVLPVGAQAPEIDATNPEGALLAKIGLSEEPSEKLEFLQQFVDSFPESDALGWVYAQQVQWHQSREEHQAVLASAAAAFALDPTKAGVTNRLRTAATAVKSAETLGDADAIVQWAKASYRAAAALLEADAPEDEEELGRWEAEKTYAKQVSQYANYVYLSMAAKSTDAKEVAGYAGALRAQDPGSEYLPPILERQFVVGRASNEREFAVAAAEALTELEKGSDETLLYLASVYLETKQKQDKIIPYTDAALEQLKEKERPESMTEEEWKKQQDFNFGLAHWVQGLHHATGSRWSQANRSLRTALPLISGNSTMQAAAYFYLGVANFEIGKRSKDHKEVVDAVKYTELCTKVSSPYQAQARQNLVAIQSQFRMR